MRSWQHLKADNDVNGNPQRLYAVYELEESEDERDSSYNYWRLVEVYEEGHGGRPRELIGVPEIPEVRISVTDYELMVMVANSTGIIRYGP